jgi:hypothetical protein
MKNSSPQTQSEVFTTVQKNVAENCCNSYSKIIEIMKSLMFIVLLGTVTVFLPFDVFAANPIVRSSPVNARVLIPQTTNVYKNIAPPSATCNYYNASDSAGTWNGKFSSKGSRLSNAESQNLTFPLPPYTYEHNGVNYTISVTADDVNRYYEFEMFPTTSGYTRIETAYLTENCHGYSTGLGYWMDSFNTLMTDDYVASTSHHIWQLVLSKEIAIIR